MKKSLCLFLLSCFSVALPAIASAQEAARNCDSLPNSDHPKTTISNGLVSAVIYLPDAKDGYYRASRFDWSGVVGCLAYQGHTYFGEWSNPARYNPLRNDAITGPVEEFRSEEGAIGYNDAKPGDLFVKVGVGTLRRVDDKPYSFGFTYPLVDGGTWTTKSKPNQISFQQKLSSPTGVGYVYTKVLKLEKNKPILVLEHTLKNTGTKTIDTGVYDHDFFMLDGKTTGPGMVAHFNFVPKPAAPFSSAATIEGTDIVFHDTPGRGRSVADYITGYSDKVSDYDFTVEDRNTGVGVQQTGDHPLYKAYFWSTPTTICPEGYIHIVVPPGKTVHWKIQYRFFAGKK